MGVSVSVRELMTDPPLDVIDEMTEPAAEVSEPIGFGSSSVVVVATVIEVGNVVFLVVVSGSAVVLVVSVELPIGIPPGIVIPLSEVDAPAVLVIVVWTIVVSTITVELTGTALFLMCFGKGAYLGYNCSASTRASTEAKPVAIVIILTMLLEKYYACSDINEGI